MLGTYHEHIDTRLQRKLEILADAAKYDASCASSGAEAAATALGKDGLGSTTGAGICHAYTPDGRCVSLLKILLTNYCLSTNAPIASTGVSANVAAGAVHASLKSWRSRLDFYQAQL